ncbi:MAG: sulfurtransferase [Thermoprotei archaeon]|jgi:thiosulfate/3-mercaptopyruvate sulfurtransferase
MSESYVYPNVLVSTQWVDEHKHDPNVRIVEVDYDPQTAYYQGHIEGAVLFDWKQDINDKIERNIISKEGFEALLSRNSISNDTTVILYGDFNNWFAAFAFWIFKYYGHDDVRLMNGGRKKWISEERKLVRDVPKYPPVTYVVKKINYEYRILLPDVRVRIGNPHTVLVDVRSPDEFSGRVTAPPEYPTEHAQRGGHIPGAINIPWSKALNDDGTFKSVQELRKLYESLGITPDKEIVTYCRIGERSSVTWFVLKYLLGYPKVRNYDGSWTEWGNVIGLPIEK